MPRSVRRYLRHGIRLFWGLVLLMVIGFAVIVQIGRLLFPYMNDYRQEIEQVLSTQLGAEIDIGTIQASWKGMRPRVLLEDIQVSNAKQTDLVIFNAQSAELEISLLSFFHDWRLAFRTLSFTGLSATFEQNDNGLWHVRGLPNTSYQKNDQRNPIIDDPLDIFLFGRRLHLLDTQLTFVFDQGVPFDLAVPQISLDNDDDFHRLSAALSEQQGEDFFTLIIEAYGDPRDEKGFDASGYVKLNRFPADKLWQALDEIWKTKEGKPLLPKASADALLDVELWTQGTLNKGFFVHGDVHVDGIPFELSQGELPQSIHSAVIGKWSRSTGWRASLHKFQLSWPAFSSPEINMGFAKPLGESMQLKVDEIDLEAWQKIIVQTKWLQDKGLEVLQSLSPSGSLRNARLLVTNKEDGYFRLSADARSLNVNAWRGAPALVSVDGFIDTSAYQGSIMLDAQSGFSMHFPKIYDAPMVFDKAHGEIRWDVDMARRHLGLSSGLLTLTHQDYIGKGHFNFRAPLQKSDHYEQSLTLEVGLDRAPVNAHSMLVPSKIPKNLYDWINQAIQSGNISDAGFIYHGSVKNQTKLFKAIQLSMDVEQGGIQFAPDWPALTDAYGHFYLDNNDVFVSGISGKIKGNQISDAQVHVPRGQGVLNIEGQLKGKTTDALSLLGESPVKENVGDSILSWRAGGDYKANAKLVVPLAEKAHHKAAQNIAITLNQGEIDVKPARLPLRKISGDLTYSGKKGFHAEKLKGRLFGEDIEVGLTTLQDPNKVLQIDFDSHLKARDLKAWLHLNDSLQVEGGTDIEGRIDIPYNSHHAIVVTASSDLVDLVSNVPAPLNKTAEAVWPATLQFTFKRDKPIQRSEYWVSVKNQMEMRAALEENSLSALSIGFNELAGDLEPHHISLFGNAVDLDAGAWLDYINNFRASLVSSEPQKTKNTQAVLGHYTIESALSVRRVTWHDQKFDHVSLVSDSDPFSWRLLFENADIKGEYTHYYDGATPLLTLDRLVLPANEVSNADAQDLDKQLDPRSFPALIVDAKGIRVGQQTLGDIAFTAQSIENGLILSDLKANFNGLLLGRPVEEKNNKNPAELIWVRTDEGNKSYLSAKARTSDIGKVLTKWGKDQALTSKKMTMDVDLEWDGAPHEVSLNGIKGRVDLSLSRGRFIRGASAGENPLLKLIGLLNFDTLARRLRLDFSDLNPQGMAYEKVDGTLLFDVGRIEVKRPLTVETPASNISFTGNIDLEQQKLDAEVNAVLPLTGNLTMAAAVTGGLPAAIGVYLAGKLFKNQVESIASLKYDVQGPWDEPKVKLKTAVKVDPPNSPQTVNQENTP